MLVRYGCCGYAAAASGANRRAAPVGAPMSAEDAEATEQLLLQEALRASLEGSPAPPPAAAAAGRIASAPARAPARPLWPALQSRPSSSVPMPKSLLGGLPLAAAKDGYSVRVANEGNEMAAGPVLLKLQRRCVEERVAPHISRIGGSEHVAVCWADAAGSLLW